MLMQMEHGGRNELDKVNELRNLNTCGLNQDIIGRDVYKRQSIFIQISICLSSVTVKHTK